MTWLTLGAQGSARPAQALPAVAHRLEVVRLAADHPRHLPVRRGAARAGQPAFRWTSATRPPTRRSDRPRRCWRFVLPVFVAGVLGNGEEIGWRGYALPRLQSRYAALFSALVDRRDLGAVAHRHLHPQLQPDLVRLVPGGRDRQVGADHLGLQRQHAAACCWRRCITPCGTRRASSCPSPPSSRRRTRARMPTWSSSEVAVAALHHAAERAGASLTHADAADAGVTPAHSASGNPGAGAALPVVGALPTMADLGLGSIEDWVGSSPTLTVP